MLTQLVCAHDCITFCSARCGSLFHQTSCHFSSVSAAALLSLHSQIQEKHHPTVLNHFAPVLSIARRSPGNDQGSEADGQHAQHTSTTEHSEVDTVHAYKGIDTMCASWDIFLFPQHTQKVSSNFRRAANVSKG